MKLSTVHLNEIKKYVKKKKLLDFSIMVFFLFFFQTGYFNLKRKVNGFCLTYQLKKLGMFNQ